MVIMPVPLGQVGGGVEAGESLKIVDKVGLVEIAAAKGHVSPINSLVWLEAEQHPLETLDTAKQFGRQADFLPEMLDKAARTEANLVSDRRDGRDDGFLEFPHGKGDGRMRGRRFGKLGQ